MGLTKKSRRVLDLLMFSGRDALTLAANPKSLIYGTVGWSTNRNAYRHIDALRDKSYVALDKKSKSGEWVVRVTREGRKKALDEIDPESSWNQDWDGKWISFSFDLPQAARKERQHLRKWLKKRRFGRLQGSLWISHREYAGWTKEIESEDIDPRSLLFQAVIPVGRQTSHEYVEKAWPFKEINKRYSEHVKYLERGASNPEKMNNSWFEEESNLWKAAFELDPFLPNEILPKGYQGRESWNLRKKVFSRWATTHLKSEK